MRLGRYAAIVLQLCVTCADVKCPTDARRRPDQRYLEEDQVTWVIISCYSNSCMIMQVDKAAAEKHRLEEKQRAARRERQQTKQEWKPRCVCVCVCARACVCVCVRACACMHACACMRVRACV